MQIRTKHFIIFLLGVVLFIGLVVNLAFTSDIKTGDGAASVALSLNTSKEEVIYQAEASTNTRQDRPGRLAELRNKIASQFIPEPEPVPEPEVVEEEVEPESGAISLCGNYQKYSQFWNPNGLKFEVIEGARILSRESVVPVDSTTSSSTDILVLQLPLRSQLYQNNYNCLRSDVVAIALDGSLIRNEDFKLYAIFGSETVVGYTLDGFALHGSSNLLVDTCGGATVDGEYRYYLSSEREGVLGCFSSTPINI